jgi:hypothetical protein
MRTLTREICLLIEEYQQQHGRVHDDYRAGIEEAIKSDPKTFFLLKKKAQWLPISYAF